MFFSAHAHVHAIPMCVQVSVGTGTSAPGYAGTRTSFEAVQSFPQARPETPAGVERTLDLANLDAKWIQERPMTC